MLNIWAINVVTIVVTVLVWIPFLRRWLGIGFRRASLLAVVTAAAEIPFSAIFMVLPAIVTPFLALPMMALTIIASLIIVAFIIQRLQTIAFKQALFISLKLYVITLVVRFIARLIIALFS
jgi:hypothetical protein